MEERKGKSYYYVLVTSSDIKVVKAIDFGCDIDGERFGCGNYFTKKNSAMEVARKMGEALPMMPITHSVAYNNK